MKKSLALLGLIGGLVFNQAATATVFAEVGDAGSTLATAQTLTGGTSTITGQLDSVDIYRFGWGGGLFTARTFTGWDPMLFVFDLAGNSLAFNDDYFGLESFISPTLAAGDYLLAITSWPQNFNGNLSGFANFGSQPGGSNYTIELRTPTRDVPEPASLALLGLGIAGLAAARRRKST